MICEGMAAQNLRPIWRGQRPWFEIWFAVVLDASRRRAIWVRQDILVPRDGEARGTIWGAWFDADSGEPARAAKRFVPATEVTELVHESRGSVDLMSGLDMTWDLSWADGRDVHAEVPAWVPAPTHAQPIAYDADASGTVKIGAITHTLQGRATAMHLWGKKRVPTLQWIWAPWIGDGSLEIQAVSLRDSFSLGLATLRLDGPDIGEPRTRPTSLRGRPATAAHPNCLVTATVAGPRRLVHARAWAEPQQMVGYAYRDTDGRDIMVAQSDIGSAHLEVYERKAPGTPWHPIDERRAAGGAAVEIHQHAALPDVNYIGWDETSRAPAKRTPEPETGVEWPAVNAIVALGLTYGDHIRETGRKLEPNEPPTSFTKHERTFAPGAGGVRVPDAFELFNALDEVEPGLAMAVREKLPIPLPVMDYEGEIALVALDDIDDERLSAGVAQPFGLAAANDLTARLCQVLGENMERSLDYWTCAKSFARFLPLAPRVWAPPGGLATMPELTISTRVNGEVRQHASTKLLIYDLAAMVRAARAHLGRPLLRGDIVLTGTPAGVGLRLSPLKRRVAALVKDRFRKAELLVSSYATSNALLRPGDVVEVDAGAAGRIRTRLTL